MRAGQYEVARKQFDATIGLIDHFDKMDVRNYPSKWRSLPQAFEILADKLGQLRIEQNLDELRQLATEKRILAERYAAIRGDADESVQRRRAAQIPPAPRAG